MLELTTSQAVRTYEVHPNVLNRLILMGRISARKNTDGHWLISKESLEQWNAQRVRRAQRVTSPTETREEIAVPATA